MSKTTDINLLNRALRVVMQTSGIQEMNKDT
jgi:hypothetical protein